MIGLLVIIVVSWLLLHFFEKENIRVLGIFSNKNRVCEFLVGWLIITLISLVNIYVETEVLHIEWKLNSINYPMIFDALWYHLKSALTEDLVFRGAILFILVRRLGANVGILISAIVFGVYHWFSYGIINDRIVLLIYVFLITGFTGYVWAYTFSKTKSIMMGLGFHLGINFINACFFQSQPYGELILQELSRIDLRDWNWLYFNLFKGLFPSIITLLFVKQYLRFKSKSQLTNQN